MFETLEELCSCRCPDQLQYCLKLPTLNILVSEIKGQTCQIETLIIPSFNKGTGENEEMLNDTDSVTGWLRIHCFVFKRTESLSCNLLLLPL